MANLTHSDIEDLKQVMDELTDFRENSGLVVEGGRVRLSSGSVVSIEIDRNNVYSTVE